jgi:copper chaperone CopZ
MKSMARGIFKLHTTGKTVRAQRARRSLLKLDGVSEVEINYITHTTYVEYDPSKVTPEMIKNAIEGSHKDSGQFSDNHSTERYDERTTDSRR